jgi:hypothetical protein
MIKEPITINDHRIDDLAMDKLSKSSHEQIYEKIHYGIDFTIQCNIP